MVRHRNGLDQERRDNVRLASGRKVDAVVLDQHAQPITLLRDVEVVNVSAGGLMLLSGDPVKPGARVELKLSESKATDISDRPFGLRAIACSPHGEQKHKIHCRLDQGGVPANLIYGW